MAFNGSRRDARSAGNHAASTPTAVASTAVDTNSSAPSTMGNSGLPSALRAMRVKRTANAPPSPAPSSDPPSPTMPPCSRNTPSMRCRGVPMARRMPISRWRCTTDTTSTLAMPSATATVTKARIMRLEALWLRSAVTNWPLAACQLSAISPVARRVARDVAPRRRALGVCL